MPQPSELLLRYAECTDDDSYDSAVEDEFYNGEDPWDENPYKRRVFHKFTELPPELRIKIWKLGLAGLAQPQLLEFSLQSSVRKDHNDMVPDEIGMPYPRRYRDWTINGSPSLVRATELNRNVMAVNREARDVALKLLPHTLKIKTPTGDGIVNFDRNRDIVQLRGYNYEVMHPFPVEERFQDFVYNFDGFADNVVQLAIRHNDFFDEDEDTSDYFTLAFQQFRNLKRLFLLSTHDKFATGDILWCGSGYIYVRTTMITDGRNEPLWTKWCWPNADEYDDFTRNQVSSPITHLLPSAALPLLRDRGIELFPMVMFEDKYALGVLKKLKGRWASTYAEGNLLSESESSEEEEVGEETEPDEYESEGIDDSEIPESDGGDDEDGSISGDDIYGEEHGSENTDLSGAIVGEIVPVFSDPEPEPEAAGGAKNSRKRRIITDSDDEDDISEKSGRKHARTGSFPVPDEGSEDEVIGRPSGAGRSRRRAAVIDSDDSDDSDDGEDEDGGGAFSSKPDKHGSSKKEEAKVGRGKKRGKADKRMETDEDDEDDDDDDEDEEIMDVRRLSLASRLQQVRASHPSSDEESSGGEDSDKINDDEDDDEDEDEDEDEEMYGGGLIDGYADESDDSGDY